MKRSVLRNLTGAAGLIVLLVLLVIVNVLAAQVRARADLTGEKLYTLSAGTRKILGGLDRDVTLKLYYSRSAEGLPSTFKQYAQRIQDLLREYQALSGGRVALQVLDPKPDSDDEEWAQKYGLNGTHIDPMGEGPAVYLGLVALAGAKQESIPFFSPADEPQLEYLVTRLVSEVTTAKKTKIGVLSELPVMGTQDTMFSMGRGSDAWAFLQELRNQYDMEELPSMLDEVPPDIDTVLLIHPRELPEISLYALDQFVLRGGRLVAFVDPLCLTELNAQQRDMQSPFGARSDLNRLTSTWGITMETDRVVADTKAATMVQMPDGSARENLAWLTLRSENLNQTELSTAGLEMMMLPLAGAFRGKPADGITLTPLITSAPGAGLITSMEATMGTMAGTTTFQRQEEPLNIAVRLTGTFKTAFPAGRPQNKDLPESTGGHTNSTHLAQSTKEGVVILVGDVDMLSDGYAVRRMNLLGRTLYQLANDNINFVANLAGQLSGSDALIGLRSRGSFERPFTRVLTLQKNAQEQWREKELALQARLRDTQSKLSELDAAKDPEQKLVVTPEQRHQIDQFRQQMIETRRQLKEVRKNLRHDIEVLGLWLKGVNFAAMPALVIVFGLAHGWRRRRRARI